MTLRELIYDVRERLKLASDDMDFTDEYIAHVIHIKRSLLIKQRFSKFTRNIPEEVKQLMCINLEVVDTISGQPCFGDILRSVETIPNLIEIGGRSALVGVRVLDRLHPYINIISMERLPFVGHNNWLSKQIYVALDADNKLYFKSDNPLHYNLEEVQVIAVVQNPEEADALLCDKADDDCEFFDKDYPIDSYLVHDIINLIIAELAPGLNIPDDKVNNADESNRN